MVSLTLQEKKVLWFVAFLFVAGAGLSFWRQSTGCNFCLIDIYGAKKAAQPLDLNSATREELIALPGIGEKLAEAILLERSRRGRFASVEDLKVVSGLTEKRMSGLRNLVKV
jgi:competence ComEA-like helix-hairpin-helix protein